MHRGGRLTSQLPAPLVPAEVDLTGYRYMPYYGDRLRDSDLNGRATDAEYRAAHNLWWAAWKQVPAASLPNDDGTLCKLADLGRDTRTWRAVKERAMHGFVLCSDGRYYHRVLAEVALEAWAGREEHRRRTTKARIAALEKRLSGVSNRDEKQHIECLLQGLRQQLSQASKTAVTGGNGVSDSHGDKSVTHHQGKGRGKDKGVNTNASTRGQGDQDLLKTPPATEATPEAIAKEKRIAALVLEGKIDEAKRVKAGLA